VNLVAMNSPTPADPNPGAHGEPFGGPNPSGGPNPGPPGEPYGGPNAPGGEPPFQTPGYPPGYPPGYGQAVPPPGVWSGPRPRGPVGEARPVPMTILLTVVTCGIWMILWAYWNHEEMQRYRAGAGIGGLAGALLTWIAYPVTMFTIPSEIEAMYQEEGQQSPVTTLYGLWFLVPLIGNIVWYVQIQKALNEFWIAHGAPPPS
jgi:hypothetical protein